MRGSISPHVPNTSLYTSSHDAFTTLVNAAAAQKSLDVPNMGRRPGSHPGSHSGSHSDSRTDAAIRSHIKDKPSVEGLEMSLMDGMHGRPRSYNDNDINNDLRNKSEDKMRIQNISHESETKPYNLNRLHMSGPEEYAYVMEHRRRLELEQYDMDRQRYGRSVNEQQSSSAISQPSLKFSREPFTREQFERELRQQDPLRHTSDHSVKKSEEISEITSESRHMSISRPQVSELDNEASKLFSQSFQKDNQKANSSRGQFTAANLIDAIITHQINSSNDSPNGKNITSSVNSSSNVNETSPPSGVESLFVRYRNQEKPVQSQYSNREEIVTIPDSPDPDKSYSANEKTQQVPNTTINDFSAKNITFREHIATIISKNYSNDGPTHPNSLMQIDSRSSPSVYGMPPMSVDSRNSMPPVSGSCGMLEGIAAAAVSNAPSDCNSSQTLSPPHSSWKLRKALQQDKEVKESDERQIIRIVQNMSPKEQKPVKSSSPSLSHYNVEPISPPTHSTETSVQIPTTFSALQTTWSPSIQNAMSSRHFYCPESSDVSHSNSSAVVSKQSQQTVTTTNQTNSNSNRTNQSQIGLSPLDYVKNRIVEVMRTTTDDTNDDLNKRNNSDVQSFQNQNNDKPKEEPDSKISNIEVNEYVEACPESTESLNKTSDAVIQKQEKPISPPITSASKTSSLPVTISSSSRPQSASPSSSQSAVILEDNQNEDQSLPKKMRKGFEDSSDCGEAESSAKILNSTISASNDVVAKQAFDSKSNNNESTISQSSAEDNNKTVSNDSIHNISSSESTETPNREKSNWEVSSACNDETCDDKQQDSKQTYPDSPNSPGEMVIDESVSTQASSSSPIDKADAEFPPSSTTQSTQQCQISTSDIQNSNFAVSTNKKLIISSSSENALPDVPNQSHSVSSSVIELNNNPIGVSSGLSSTLGSDQTKSSSNSTPQTSQVVTTQSERYSPSNSANSVSSSGTNLFKGTIASMPSSNTDNSSSLSQTAVNTSGGNDSKTGGRDFDNNRLFAYNFAYTPFTVSSTAPTPSIGTSSAEPLTQSTGSTIQSSAISASGTPSSTTSNAMAPQYEPLSDDE